MHLDTAEPPPSQHFYRISVDCMIVSNLFSLAGVRGCVDKSVIKETVIILATGEKKLGM